MDTPLGFGIGNSLEVIESMEVLKGRGPDDLTEVSLEIAANMLYLVDKGSLEECQKLINQNNEENEFIIVSEKFNKYMNIKYNENMSVEVDKSNWKKRISICMV